ncbi:uncharacterized protein I206_105527 [Kwoniella pini CBS 10737]|uniref:Uncharacterized protein n=1 Tax=Kwoniella pini CBS 10737 TaxID=1296096 RepID=A0A1B9I400_9TREE|nr:uncharacterized protein I206_03571 [Kwoniella pini CBS 10737]OCF50252.1 hypothetical protein I206_03571 [Kwoniella pini CBS 10737]
MSTQELVENTYLPGYRFVRYTLEPPRAYFQGETYRNFACTYLQIPSEPKEPVYYTHFEFDGIKISREDVCKAWAYGLNGAMFHDIVQISTKQASASDINSSIESSRAEISYREWYGCYRELEYAMALIHRWEKQGIILDNLQKPKRYTLHDLTLCQSRTTEHTKPQELTGLFIYAFKHIMELEKQGYADEFKSIFRTLPDCEPFEPFILPNVDDKSILPPPNETHSEPVSAGQGQDGSIQTKHVTWETVSTAKTMKSDTVDKVSVSSEDSSKSSVKKAVRSVTHLFKNL